MKNNILKIAICDDEETIQLKQKIEHCMNTLTNMKYEIHTFVTGVSLLKHMIADQEKVHILFLDIKMEQMDGLDTARKIRTVDKECIIIFLTYCEEYVFQSFKVNPFRYIRKAQLDMELPYAIEDAVKRIDENDKEELFYKYKIYNEEHQVLLKHIVYFESKIRKVLIYVQDENMPRIFYGKIKDVQSEMRTDIFIRCHQSFIVNICFIKEIKNNEIILKNRNKSIPVSEKYRDDLRKARLWAER